ncbi:hypothetical protein GE061_008282 [Apolygus lucorum]|uniref:Kinesin motor domain-containing protein n=1 Tax=Apolygus lucorum TaxID=248454 RepID=A0A8S9WQN0_APOLU|nr:hypothetical protein GE061_008282 [Apolygus lucorum]
MTSPETIDDNVGRICNMITYALEAAVPKSRDPTHLKALPSRIANLLKTKNRVRKNWQHFRYPEDKRLFNELQRLVHIEIEKWTQSTWDDKLSKMTVNDNSIWKLTKWFNSSRSYSVPTLRNNDTVATGDQEKAEMLSNHFLSVHTDALARGNASFVFKPSASQSEVFDEVIRPKLNHFFKGNDSLVFSYGTSNSGKSITMQGTRDQPGIIPRVVHVIYQSIHGHTDTELKLKPYKSCQATIFNERERKELLDEKSAIFESLHSSLTESHDTSLSGISRNMPL